MSSEAAGPLRGSAEREGARCLKSMTGFGAATGPVGPFHLRIEARSVNHRHLQIKLRLPQEFSALEPEVEAVVRKGLERGSVALTATTERVAETGVALVDRALARQYLGQIRELSGELGLEMNVGIAQLLALPGVVAPPSGGELPERARHELAALVRKALDALVEMRTVEGRALADDLRVNLEALAVLVERIEKRMPKVVRQQQKNLRKRVEELLGAQSAVSPTDLAREIALIADRSDVAEELARLKSHVAQFESEMRRSDSVGRRLDFLVQELLREVNTIASKCNDADVAHWSVDIKARIERLREQVQNIE
jgi:uncharacterized protein (TIGR00255 family)